MEEAQPAAALSEAQPAAAPAGGVFGMLGGLFGGKPAMVAEEAPAKAAPTVSTGGFGGNCTLTNGVKRCRFGN